MENRKIALLIAMLFSFVFSSAQQTDTLDEVNVKANRKQESADERINSFSKGQKIKSIDSIILLQYQFQSLANLLSQQVPVFVKSYGFNSLATLNFRGASAAQSQVYWNGVPLSNAATGITDVSLLRTSLYNKVNIVYGGSSALWGSGNVGGALVLESERPYFSKVSRWSNAVSVMAGSFAQYQIGARSSISSKKWFVAANLSAQTAKNDFRYTDNGLDKQTANSEMQSASAQLQVAYKVNEKNVFSIVGWWQNFYREIPGAIFESYSAKKQEDQSIRFVANWNRTGIKLNLYSRVSYMQDDMHYSDSVVQLDARYKTSQVYAEAGAKYNAGKHHKLLLFAPVQVAWMQSTQQPDITRQPRFAIAGAYVLSVFHNRLNFTLNGRLRLNNDKSIPLSGISISYACTQWLTIRSNIQRSFRLPTLNELYYQPGGNPNLKPEQGWSSDIGYTVKTKSEKKLVFYQDVSLFNRRIQDWIIWFGGAIWTPHNIAEVHSRGIETESNLQFKIHEFTLHAGVNSSYVLATTVQSYIPNDGSIGKQIPYSPRYNGQANLGFAIKRWYFNYNHTYTGYRFITVDESSWLLPYNTGNIQLMYTQPLKHSTIQWSAQCNNVWNTRYQVVSGRPMPGLNWLVGLVFRK